MRSPARAYVSQKSEGRLLQLYRGRGVTNNAQGLLNDRRLTEFAYALPRTRWNIGLTQRMEAHELPRPGQSTTAAGTTTTAGFARL